MGLSLVTKSRPCGTGAKSVLSRASETTVHATCIYALVTLVDPMEIRLLSVVILNAGELLAPGVMGLIDVFPLPVAESNAWYPIATLLIPVVLFCNAFIPVATL